MKQLEGVWLSRGDLLDHGVHSEGKGVDGMSQCCVLVYKLLDEKDDLAFLR